MKHNIIFLDIDGVLLTLDHMNNLHTKGKLNYKILDPECVRRFNILVCDTRAKVVVSSTWRLGCTLEEISQELFSRGVVADIIGMTPRLPSSRDSSGISVSTPRGKEIQAWIDSNEEKIKKFVILDDDSDMVHLSRFLVRTSFAIGLQDKECDRVREIFNEE